MMPTNVFARFQLKHSAAIRALGLTRARDIQIDLWVVVPNFHVCIGVGAKDAALCIQVSGHQFHIGGFDHA